MDTLQSIEQRLANIESLLSGVKTVLTLTEAAEYCRLSQSYMYKLTSAGLIPHYKPAGKMLYFKREELDAWMLRNEVKTSSSIDAQATNYVVTNKRG
ncbi:helix-turn-helix domain-containing protein [Taibaiella soli]|uniref:DNA-binding protein n=1 Tax=Taibaiella soli TaxID=1649169 RepID=A0A2W2B0W3_9BACT|nr:helix-turn-helix domain-containing protein [Taibaiella soli]PZF73638.1 DNA-binding protein [Taibaiella soli]